MINKLRIRFIAIAMASLVVVLGAIFIIVNAVNYAGIVSAADTFIEDAIAVDGIILQWPSDTARENGPRREYFSATVSSEGDVDILLNFTSVLSKTAQTYVSIVYDEGKTDGFLETFRYGSALKEEGTLYVFVDCARELDTFYTFLYASTGFGVGGVVLVFLLVFIASAFLFRPVKESYLKQREFITNVSHDIKTPLTIIDADAEVLEMEHGESEWTRDIKAQVERLASLTEKMILLSRMEESGYKSIMTEFSLSDAVAETAKSFVPIAEKNGKQMDLQVEKNISYVGDENVIRKLVEILLDNSIKYSSDGGKIGILLNRNTKNIELIVSNQTKDLKLEDLSFLFDRFYRAESSRNSDSGGHGIGLSIAKAIVTAHKGKITAKLEENVIKFTITL